jgi:hypothetical protein
VNQLEAVPSLVDEHLAVARGHCILFTEDHCSRDGGVILLARRCLKRAQELLCFKAGRRMMRLHFSTSFFN